MLKKRIETCKILEQGQRQASFQCSMPSTSHLAGNLACRSKSCQALFLHQANKELNALYFKVETRKCLDVK